MCPVHPLLSVVEGSAFHNCGWAGSDNIQYLCHLEQIFALSSPAPYRLNCLRIASKNSANNDDVSNVSKIATTRPRG